MACGKHNSKHLAMVVQKITLNWDFTDGTRYALLFILLGSHNSNFVLVIQICDMKEITYESDYSE